SPLGLNLQMDDPPPPLYMSGQQLAAAQPSLMSNPISYVQNLPNEGWSSAAFSPATFHSINPSAVLLSGRNQAIDPTPDFAGNVNDTQVPPPPPTCEDQNAADSCDEDENMEDSP